MDAIAAAHDSDIQMIDSSSVRAHQQPATAKEGYRSLFRSTDALAKFPCEVEDLVSNDFSPCSARLLPGTKAHQRVYAGIPVNRKV